MNIRVSAVVLRDAHGRILMVRKRGTTMWMNPGGKPEPGESAAECAAREVGEELGLRLDPHHLLPLGEFAAPAANEAGFTVVADVFD
ncbi:MAG: NUDIX domain-containing protein [Tessaracoccus sp.]